MRRRPEASAATEMAVRRRLEAQLGLGVAADHSLPLPVRRGGFELPQQQQPQQKEAEEEENKENEEKVGGQSEPADQALLLPLQSIQEDKDRADEL